MQMHEQLRASPLCFCKVTPLDPDNATYVLRGVGCCNRQCFKKAEEQQLQHIAKAAGRVHSHWLVSLAGALAFFMLAYIFSGGHRAFAHDPYSSWQRPDGKGSCCNESDCRQARAYSDDQGTWRVLINGEWRIVPQASIRDYPPPDGNSHVCETPSMGIMCFVRGLPKS